MSREETYGEWLRREGPDSPHVTSSERALLLWEAARDAEAVDEVAMLDALLGRTVRLSTSRATVLGDMESHELAEASLSRHDDSTRRLVTTEARFVVRARFGSRLLGIEQGSGDAYLLRAEWLTVVPCDDRVRASG